MQVTLELYGHLRNFPKLHSLSTVLLSGFQSAAGAFVIQLSKTVSGNFHGSGGYSKYNRLQDRAKIQRSWALQIALNLTLYLGLMWICYKLSIDSRYVFNNILHHDCFRGISATC